MDADVRSRLDNLTKPKDSLGRLEDIVVQFCSVRGTLEPHIEKKTIFTFAGDHGVAEEGVSAYPKAVTPQMVRNMLAGGAAVNVLARHVGAEVRVVDIGVDDPLENAPGLVRRKVRMGTSNIARGPAMTVDEALRAIHVGIELAREAQKDGAALLGVGDMGIANTTPSAALYAALLPAPVEEVTGRGTGIDDNALSRKVNVIKRALTVNRDSLSDALNALAAVGGFEIAGITGVILGAASCRIPVVVDGFISSAGALVACRMCDRLKDYLFFSHCSQESGHKAFFRRFGVEPLLDLGMRLGEGTGAALAVSLIEAAVKIYNEMATFGSAGVSGRSTT
ncbi:MAG: nicotinate-nucleotide--dimethylbenzimidazole phosphoribosyltransferase [Nitrospirae bacterium]|nr:nicotinate-nucleotide--dimethylbenzimidazole phosphoribosyltransferase [Nitrospirota bacterium]